GRKSLFGQLTGMSIMGTEIAISVAMFFVSVPFLINAVKNGFKLIDPRYEKVAITLGASPLRAFFTISLPMVKRSILSGSIMMWARGISEFGAVIILAYHPMITPILIYDRYEAFGLKYARPVAVVLILICLLVFISLRLLEDKGRRSDDKV
ncbi:MAG: ABC transporter permease, partial [Candidatus Delongbacteria bacterium]|nr:ABC transporter permease [Candidatus Delongbacteria bacterium]